MSGRLEGKVAIVTGGAGGIGSAACELFAREGAKVIVAELRPEGDAVPQRIRAAGGQATYLETDVTDTASVQALVDRTMSLFGKLNVLYNNAGGSSSADGDVTTTPLEVFWETIRFDLYSVYVCCKHAIPAMLASGGGSIINTGSTLAERGLPGRDSYSAAKGGVVAMTRSIAAEYGKKNIRCNSILPGGVATPRVVEMLKAEPKMKQITDRQILGLADPIDVAYMALFLASDESRRVTAQAFGVDGGLLNT